MKHETRHREKMWMANTKLKRLFTAVAMRRGKLTSGIAVAEAMTELRKRSNPENPEPRTIHPSQISGWFSGDRESLMLPAEPLGLLLAVFREAGIPIERNWLCVEEDEFDRLLEKSTGINARPELTWPDCVRLHAKSYDGLRLRRPMGFRMKWPDPKGPARVPIETFCVDEPVQLTLKLPDNFQDEKSAIFATIVEEAANQALCLFPRDGIPSAPLAGPLIRFPDGQLPDGGQRYMEVTPPLGVQRMHVLVTRFLPAVPVHSGLEEINLQISLDRLASELATRPAGSWNLWSISYQVMEAAKPARRAISRRA
jgi:hypothetical protein